MNKTLLTFGLLGLLAAGSAVAVSNIHNNQRQTSTNASNTIAESHPGHSMSGMNPSEMPTEQNSFQNEHSGHSGSAVTAKSSLVKPGKINLNQPTPLIIEVTNQKGKAIAQFDTFQEKLMHLIVVSDDLLFFDHIHPAHKGNGRFEVAATLPQPGSYTLFSDYKPTGQKEVVSVLKLQASGRSSPASAIDLRQAKSFGDTKASLSFGQTTIKAGEEVALNFSLQQATNNQPITDLQPYLGERGHLVILKQSAPLTRTDYIHAHAMKNTPAGQITFMTKFPQPGNYKLWGQFNRNGKIVITDFWVNII
jgi:hypothetical protein